MGWAAKGYIRGGVGSAVSKRFDNEQKQFLHSIFDTYKRTGVKVHEKAAHEMMVKHFNQTGEGQALSKRKVLRVAQIKSWLSQENARRKKQGLMTVMTRGLQEVAGVLRGGDILGGVPGGGDEGRAGCEVQEDEEGGEEIEEEGEVGGAHVICGAPAPSRPLLVPTDAADPVESQSGVGEDSTLTESPVVGSLWLVIKEEWDDVRGFEVWETRATYACPVLPEDMMMCEVPARKWIHGLALMTPLQATVVDTVCLMDKLGGGLGKKLGKPGERRFAPRTGRAFDMTKIVPCEFCLTLLLNCGLTRLTLFFLLYSPKRRSVGTDCQSGHQDLRRHEEDQSDFVCFVRRN